MLKPIHLQSPCWSRLPSTPQGAPPPSLHLGKCMCHTLLHVADLSMERKWQYAGSHLIIPHGAQFTHRFSTIIETHNHSSPLRNAEGVPYPMETVRDFTLEDKIFPDILGDSLLFDGTRLMRLWQKNYSILMHLPLVSHTGHSSNVAFRGVSSHSTFESDTEALSQGITPPVTPPHCPPNSRDGKKSHCHHSPKEKVIPKKKDEAKHKDKAMCKDSDSTSSKRSHGGKGGKHGSSKDSAPSSLKHTLDPTDSPSQRKRIEPRLEASPGPTNTQSCAPSPQKDMTDMDEQPSFLSPPAMTSTPHKIRGEHQHSMSINSIPSVTSFDPQPYPSFSYIGPVGMGPGSTPTLSLSGSQCVTSSGFCLPEDKSFHIPPITHLSWEQAAEIYQLVTDCQELYAEVT